MWNIGIVRQKCGLQRQNALLTSVVWHFLLREGGGETLSITGITSHVALVSSLSKNLLLMQSDNSIHKTSDSSNMCSIFVS